MRRTLVLALAAILVCSSSVVSFAASDVDRADKAATTDDDQNPRSQSEGEDSEQSQADSDRDVMKKFTRHRPGACPEGPPCSVED